MPIACRPVAEAAAAAALVCALGAAAAAQDISARDLLRGFGNPARWLTYSGDYTGTRHSPLTQITPQNAAALAPIWTFQTGAVPESSKRRRS